MQTMKRTRSFPGTRLLMGAVLAAACLAPSASAQKKAKVFGFYPNFDLTPMVTNAQLDLLTHVIYFSIRMPTDGNVTDAYVISQINGQKLVDIIYRAKDKGVKVLLGVGGWELSQEFAGVASSDAKRKLFASSAAKFCTANGLAGIDIDWEFPQGNQSADLAQLLGEMNKTFKPASLITTLSVNGLAPQYYGSASLNAVDYVLIMSYDNGTPHSTYDQAVQSVAAFSGQVTTKSKLILGVPFYGKSGGATKTYAELYKMSALGPATNDASGYNFNGPDLIAQKSGYIIDQGGGGTMIWQVSQDAFTPQVPGGILLAAMNKGFTSKGATLDKIIPVAIAPRAGRPAQKGDAGSGFFSARAFSMDPETPGLTLFSPDGRTLRSVIRDSRTGQAGSSAPAAGRYLYRMESAKIDETR